MKSVKTGLKTAKTWVKAGADKAKAIVSQAKTAVADMPEDDCALAAMGLGVGSLGLLSGVGPNGFLGLTSLVAGSAAIGFGFKGKKTDKDTMRKCSIWGVALGAITVSSWLVAKKYIND